MYLMLIERLWPLGHVAITPVATLVIVCCGLQLSTYQQTSVSNNAL